MFCNAEKAWLSQKGIPFTERDVTQDLTAIDELAGMEIYSTPVTLIDGRSWWVSIANTWRSCSASRRREARLCCRLCTAQDPALAASAHRIRPAISHTSAGPENLLSHP